MRLLHLLLFLLISCQLLWGQKNVKLKIHLEGIHKEVFNIHFYDGLVQDFIDASQKDTLMQLERLTYTPYPRILISYKGKYYNYLINKQTSTINIHYDSSKADFPFYSDQTDHITPIYDTVSSPIFRELRSCLKTERLQLIDLYSKHGSEIRTNDSVKFVLRELTKEMNSKTMEVLTSYPNDFFSFLYFKEQVLIPTLSVEDDSEYYNNLLAYYNRTFPSEFRLTDEGKQIVKDMEQKITPVFIKEGEMMPDIYFKDIYGDTIFFKNQQESFVLLDFWASWCGPCLAQIPDIRLLRNTFSEDLLKIVGISIDRDSVSFLKSIKENEMSWVHSFDRGGILSGSLGFTSIPRIVLLDRNGKIVYYKHGGRIDMQKINAILRED